jgi:hypothetical protein
VELNNIVSPVFLSFGDGDDFLNITASDSSGVSGECWANGCSGFGVDGNGIQWTSELESIQVNGGTGDDIAVVSGVAAGQSLTIDLGGGSDEYTIQAGVGGFTAFASGATLVDLTLGGVNRLTVDLSK